MTDRPGVGASLQTVRQTEPVRGWKLAKLAVINNQLTLAAYTVGVVYQAEDTAVCVPGWPGFSYMLPADGQHLSPHIDCTCGFYIMHTLGQLCESGLCTDPAVMLEVEAYGTIIQHQKGWRAQHQRVLAVWLDPLCRGSDCRSVATHIALSVAATGGLILKPVCPNCQPDNQVCYTPADIANQIHVETRWAA